MKLNYHNKIIIQVGNKQLVYFNTMLNSVYEKISNLESFCDKIAFGNGVSENYNENYKLSNHIYNANLETEALHNNLSESNLYVKKIANFDASVIDSNFITEAGITSSTDDENNPTIYNYFSFIDDDHPNGIDISGGDSVLISVYIYLNLTTTSTGLFTKGANPFINFLLGNGCKQKSIFVARGNDLSDNVLIERTNSYTGEKFECEFSSNIDNGVLLNFKGDLKSGETNEIVFILDDIVFARLNTKLIQEVVSSTETFSSKRNYVVDLGTGIDGVSTILNDTTQTEETDVYVVKYATNFATKTELPFNNLFDINTPRFISKDGDKLFFVLNDYIYLYKNEDFKINHKFSINLQIPDIVKISSFDNFVFVFAKTAPYVFAYAIEENSLTQYSIDLESCDAYQYLGLFTDIDMVQGKNGTFMLGFYAPVNTTSAYTLYYTFDEATKSFIYDDYRSSMNYTFTHMLAFHKNNFSDAQMLYLQAGETSSTCRRAIHNLNKTITSTYSTTSYYYTYLTTSLCVKSRAVVIEKNFTPNFWLYYYPQVYRFELSQFSEAQKSYISTNLLYLIQKLSDGSYRAYNLVGYDTPEEFSKGIPSEIDQSKILYVDFLIDTVLFFMDDEDEPIIAYSLNVNGTCIENVSSKDDTYSVSVTRREVLGDNNEGVIATLAINVNI